MTNLGILLLVLAVCGEHKELLVQGEEQHGFQWIEKHEAFEMMKRYSNYRIVDVRSRDEYITGHLPKAINLPIDDLEEECTELLSNRNQVIFVYCSSGVRARRACEMMAGLGYTNLYGFGGFQR